MCLEHTLSKYRHPVLVLALRDMKIQRTLDVVFRTHLVLGHSWLVLMDMHCTVIAYNI